MSPIIYDLAMSLNGFIADRNHSLQWLFEVPGAQEPDPSLFPSGAAVHVEGSSTYLWMLEQEELLENPERWQQLYGQKPTFVFTSRQLPIPDGADVRLVNGPVQEHLEQIRSAANGGDIWVLGGGELAGQFFDVGALDRIALTIAPAALASGAPVLPRNIKADRLRLMEAKPAGPFARLVYEVRSA